MTFAVKRKGDAIDELNYELDAIDHVPKWVFDRLTRCIERLSSVQPEPCADAISRAEAIKIASGYCHPANVAKELEQLPSAQPEPKTGHWEITDAYPHNVYCSECHKKFAQTHWTVWEDGSLPRNYCPNCGSYNGGGA